MEKADVSLDGLSGVFVSVVWLVSRLLYKKLGDPENWQLQRNSEEVGRLVYHIL
jgi:hypothetical protein